MPANVSVPTTLEPLSAGQILDRALRLVSNHPGLMIGLAAISVVPTQILQTVAEVVSQGLAEGDDVSVESLMLVLGSFIGVLLFSFVLGPLVTGASTYAVSEIFLGRTPTFGEALGRAWASFGRILSASIMVGLIVMGGTLLFIIPGIIWSFGLALYVPAIIVEGARAGESRRRSWELTRGYKGKVAIIYIAYGAVFFVAIMVGTFTAGLLGIESPVAIGLGTMVIVLLATPVIYAATVLLYYDLRVRKENFDLEMLGHAFHERPR